MNDWTYTTTGNGFAVTITAPDGRTAYLQGDDAADFLRRADTTNERYTDSDLCAEYKDILGAADSTAGRGCATCHDDPSLDCPDCRGFGADLIEEDDEDETT